MEKFKSTCIYILYIIINKYITIILIIIISRWAGCTHQWFEQLWKAGLSSKTGVSLIPGTRVTSDYKDDIDPKWTKIVYGFQKITDEKLRRLNEEHKSNYKYVFLIIQYYILKSNYHIA